MNKLTKFLLLLFASGATLIFVISCEDYTDKLTGSNPDGNAVDVSERITGFSPQVAGAGGKLTIEGNNLSNVEMVHMGDLWLDDFEVSESSIVLNVPPNIGLGDNEIILVFKGNARAKSSIEVIPVPSISYFTPKAVGEGDEVTILGNNLSYVSSIGIGGVEGTITSQENDMLKFTVPGGISSDVIQMTTNSGNVISSTESVIACSAEPGNLACLPAINTNGSFEDADLGEASAVSGWGGLTGSLASGEITDEEHYDGLQCFKITINDIGDQPYNIQPNSNMTVDPTATYHVSMWIKGSGIATAMFAMDQGGTPGWVNWQSPQMEVNTDEWTEVSYTFTPDGEATADGGDQTARFAISLSYEGNVGGVMYFDNLRVVEVE